MPVGELPIWGQWGILGLSLGMNLFFLVRYATGQWVARSRLEDEQKNSASWQHAWEVSMETNHAATSLLAQLTVTAQTMEKVLNALPASSVPEIVSERGVS